MRTPRIATVHSQLSCDSFVDVVLVLILMLVPLTHLSEAIRVISSPPAFDTAIEEEFDVVVEVSAVGQYSIGDDVVSDSALGMNLRAIYLARPMKRIIIHGDPRAKWQRVFTAMDSSRGAGVRVLILH